MKTNKRLLPIIFTLILVSTSCSTTTNSDNNATSEKNNLINCNYVEVTEKPNQIPIIFSAKYNYSYSIVYEYTNKNGNFIYTSYQPYLNNHEANKVEYRPFKVYENRYTNKYEEYTYNKTVGLLSVEQNVYLDIEHYVINIEINYLEYLFDYIPDYVDKNIFDNKKAYECAKKGYYRITKDEIIKDIDAHDLVEKISYKFNENYTLKYQERWF